MRNDEFRRALDECLERIREGASVGDCLEEYPRLADRLEPFLRSAATLRGLDVPELSPSAMRRARTNLLKRVAEGSGKEAAVVKGVFKYANLIGLAVAAVFVAGMGLVAAAGPSLFGGGDGSQSISATVIAQAPTLWRVERNDTEEEVYLVLTDETRYEDADGSTIDRTDIHVGDRIKARVTASVNGQSFFDAQLVRVVENAEATPKPTPEPTAEPTAAPTEAPKPTPAEPEPTEKPATPAPTEKPVAQEFWGVVLAIADTNLTLQTEMGNVTVWVNGETQYPTGQPFVGVKVWVLGTKQADGSFIGHKVTVKPIDFMGTVTGIEGGTLRVNTDAGEKVVHTNAETAFPNGAPKVGDTVGVSAYLMPDGTYTAKTIIVRNQAFSGTIVEHMAAEFTIKVDVAGTLKIVCYEFADVVGTLVVGAKVYVEVDHVEGDVYFGVLVKVVG